MARVFLATTSGRVGFQRYAAVKCLRDELAVNSEYVDMFFDEIQVVSQIAHPNVCRVFESGTSRGIPYMVMEYLSGQTMAAIRRKLAADPALLDPMQRTGLIARLMAETCEGVHAIHEGRDLCGEPLAAIHRDICPNNLMVTYDGAVKVLDLGVARSAHQRHSTAAGVVKGKYSYLAPEVIAGADPDRRTDIWSLGVVAWELLTGRRLFSGECEIDILRAVDRETEVVAPSKLVEGLPELVDDVVLCALERDPEKRLDDARELGRLYTQLAVESGIAFGLAEVADAMATLFPEGPGSVRRLYDRAETLDSDLEIPVVSLDELDGSLEVSEVEMIIEPAPSGTPVPRDGSPPARGRPRTTPPPLPPQVRSRPDLRARPWLRGALAGLLASVVGAAGFHCGKSDTAGAIGPPAAIEVGEAYELQVVEDREQGGVRLQIETRSANITPATAGRI